MNGCPQEIQDLLGTPWKEGALENTGEGLSCAGVVVAVLRAMGRPAHAEAVADAILRGVEPAGLQQVDPAQLLPGDLIVSKGRDEQLHLSIAVDPGLAFSSAQRLGCYAHHPLHVAELVACYRLPPLA